MVLRHILDCIMYNAIPHQHKFSIDLCDAFGDLYACHGFHHDSINIQCTAVEVERGRGNSEHSIPFVKATKCA